MTEAQMTADGQLVTRVCRGDLEALGDLYAKYRTTVFRTALAITRNQQVAEDILQEVFLKLHRYAERIDPTLPLAPWLYRVTANLCYTQLSRHKNWLTALEGVVENIVAPPRDTSPEHLVESHELQAAVQQAISSLRPNQKIVIVLYYLADLSLSEIAHILQVPEGTVKSRLHYGRENLRKKLERNQVVSRRVGYEFT